MFIKKVEGNPQVHDVTKGFRIVAFGEMNDPDCEYYFAFLVPEGTTTRANAPILNMRYAEGTIEENNFKILDYVQVKAFRNADGSYTINTNNEGSSVIYEFKLQQKAFGKSTRCDSPIKLFFLLLRNEA